MFVGVRDWEMLPVVGDTTREGKEVQSVKSISCKKVIHIYPKEGARSGNKIANLYIVDRN